jgi:PTH1 family peptidyl-tRNA hydrolase
MVVDELSRRWGGLSFRSKFGGELAQQDQTVVLKPMEFMNVSGQAVQRAAGFYKIGPEQTLVIHDEIDLDFGRLRVKVGGGHGGHNGLRSISECCGEGYLRVRCGVGKPQHGGKERVVGHVLGGFSKVEQEELPFLVGGAADAVELVLKKGATAAMNQVNRQEPRS